MLKVLQWKMESAAGPLYLVASEKGLQFVYWSKLNYPMAMDLNSTVPAVKILKQTVQELTEYFDGKRKKFDVSLDPQGTAFQKEVWSQLDLIPYGSTCSYAQIANRMQNPKAVRAVGAANGRNPISIIVPCHRVIGTNGKLTGYAGGLKAKSILLDLEQNHT